MDNRDKNMTFGNTLISWAIAGLVGLIAFLLFIIMGEWSLSAAAFGGAVIAIILVILFTIIFGRDLPPLGSVQAPGAKHAGQAGQGGTTGSGAGAAGAASAAGAGGASADAGASAGTGASASEGASTPAAAASSSASADASAAVGGGGAGMGGGAAAATSPAATGTPVGQGAADATTQREAAAADATAKAERPVASSGASDTGAGTSAPAPAADAATAAAAAVAEGAEEKPTGLDAPRGGQADDLKRVKGIGPKLEKLCNSMGFWHFDQIAAWKAEEIAWVDQNLEGFKGRVTRDEWVSQAKALAAGEETAFSKKVDKGDVY